MIKKIVKFFKDIYSDDIGVYNPKAEKLTVGTILYWVIGIALSFIIPAIFIYIEVGEFDWNFFRFLWGEEETAGLLGGGLYRGGYYILGLSGNGFLLLAGFASPYWINGRKEILEIKKLSRFLFPVCYIGAIACFIIANIVY